MKKKIFILILFLSFLFYLPNVDAADPKYQVCGQRSKETCVSAGEDVNGDTCKYTGGSCVVDKHNCKALKHCTCYSATSCPSYDDYGNECYDLPQTGTCIVKPTKTSVTDEEDESYNNYEEKGDVTCGNGLTFNRSIANITHYMVLLFQIIAPSMVVIFGMIDMFKAFSSGKDDQMKKSWSTFAKRLIVAVLMFLIITIVRVVISFFSGPNILDCFNCFVNGASSC